MGIAVRGGRLKRPLRTFARNLEAGAVVLFTQNEEIVSDSSVPGKYARPALEAGIASKPQGLAPPTSCFLVEGSITLS